MDGNLAMTAEMRKRAVRLRLGCILVLAALLVLCIPMPVLHALPASCSQVLVVQPGQTLATIAAAAFGRQDAVANIIAATNAQAAVDSTYTVITDPNAVEAGWKIC